MRKNHALKKALKLLIGILVGMIFIYSCKKENASTMIDPVDQQQIKDWYNLKTNHNTLNRFANMKPVWDIVHTNELSGQLIYEINLSNPDKIFLTNQTINKNQAREYSVKSNIRLVIFKDKETGLITGGCYMSAVNEGDVMSFRSMHYKNVGNFSGDVYYYNIDGTFGNGWSYREGRINEMISSTSKEEYLQFQKDLASTAPKSSGNGKVQRVYDPPCLTAQIPMWGSTCVNGICDYYITGYDYIYICTGGVPTTPGSGPGDGGGGYNPGSGGGGGGPTTGQPKEVRNNVNDPCISEGVNIAIDAKTTIRNMLNTTFLGNEVKDYDVDFYDVTNLPDTLAAVTQNENEQKLIIRLNRNILPHRSKEYIVATVYHEILHAYILTKFTTIVNNKILIPNNHEMIANNYVALLTGALRSAFPDLTLNEAWALSWGGLEDTSFYNSKLNDSERATITDINNRHQKKSTLIFNPLGTFCN